MQFTYLKDINENIVQQYKDLVNAVLKKTHSIGFLEEIDDETAETYLQEKISKSRSALILVHDDGDLLGTGYLCPTGYETTQHYGEISKVMVSPTGQGKGLGKKIMAKLEEKAKELGFTHILLDTWDVDYIVKFYKKCGYEQVGCIPQFVRYKGEYHDSYFFAKKLQ